MCYIPRYNKLLLSPEIRKNIHRLYLGSLADKHMHTCTSHTECAQHMEFHISPGRDALFHITQYANNDDKPLSPLSFAVHHTPHHTTQPGQPTYSSYLTNY